MRQNFRCPSIRIGAYLRIKMHIRALSAFPAPAWPSPIWRDRPFGNVFRQKNQISLAERMYMTNDNTAKRNTTVEQCIVLLCLQNNTSLAGGRWQYAWNTTQGAKFAKQYPLGPSVSNRQVAAAALFKLQ